MKKCPYCAEQIQDEAIVCRYCGKDLIVISRSSQTEEPTILTLLRLLEIFNICGLHGAFELEENLLHNFSEIVGIIEEETYGELLRRHFKCGLITDLEVLKSKLNDENSAAFVWGFLCLTVGIACGYNYLDIASSGWCPIKFSQSYAIHIVEYIQLLVVGGQETMEKANSEVIFLTEKIIKAGLNLEELGKNKYKSAVVTHPEKLLAFAQAIKNLPE